MNSLIVSLLLALTALGDGHQLTSLWNQYQEASKADLPKKEAPILNQIKTEAAAKHLPVDFWDAATEYVYTVQRRDWKQGQALRESLAKEVAEFNEPVVTYLWMREWDGASGEKLYKFISDNPLKGNNPAFHKDIHYLNGALAQFIESDQEWALWTLFYVKEAEQALEDAVKGKYPQEGALKYLRNYYQTYAENRVFLADLQQEYQGTAFALYPEGDLLSMDFQALEESKAKAEVFSKLYEKCRQFENRRAAFKGKEKILADSYTTVEGIVKQLTSKYLQLSVKKDTIELAFRNLQGAKVTVSQDKDVVTTWNTVNNVNSFYVYDSLKLAIPALKDGTYQVKAVNGNITSDATYQKYTISIATRTDAEGIKVYLADYQTGQPLSSAKLLLMKGDTEVANASMKINGFTLLPSAFTKAIKGHPKTGYQLVAVKDDRRSKTVGVTREAAVSIPDNSAKCNIYRDRGAYNPGDTLKMKAVVYQGDPMTKMSVCAGKQLEVILFDSEGNALETKALKTNQWGSASGEFIIPGGLRNGNFGLQVKDKDKVLARENVRVDEFVLPSFDLSFDKRTELYLEGSSVPVSGTVKSYSGHGLSGAKVRIKVSRWGGQVMEEEAPLKADGVFRFEVPARDSGFYNAEVTVVDATGETLSFTDGFYVGRSLSVDIKVLGAEDANLTLPGDSNGWRWRRETRYVVKANQFRAVFQARDAGGNAVPVDVRYALSSSSPAPTGDLVPSGKEVLLTVPQSGLYTIKATVEATLPDGEKIEKSTENKVLVLPADETELKVPDARIFIAGPNEVDDAINVRVGTSEGDAWIVTTIFGKDSQILESSFLKVRNGKIQDMSYEYNASWPDAVRLDYYYFINGKAVHYERQYRRARSKVALPLAFTSFHDKAYPGTRYTFTLKTEPGVEALAAAWDKSMDAIVPNIWNVVSQRDYSVPSVSVTASPGTVGGSSNYYYFIDRAMPMSLKSVSFARNESVDVEYELADAAEAGGTESDDVPVRSEFLAGLTFQPHLQSAKDGSLSFSFSTSDKLSTYYVRVYAHNKSMQNAVTEGEMLVSIPVKVSLQEPRFLYQGDVWEAALVVSSIADEPVSGVLSLEWEGGSAQVPVIVPAGETVTRVITVGMPDQVGHDGGTSSPAPTGDLSIIARFRSTTFSDAVRVTVPVLPAKQTLTEAHSAVLHPSDNREALLANLRSRFVNVPGETATLKEITVMDMVRDAIPSHVEPQGKDVLSLSEAWYVRQLVSMIEMPDQVGHDGDSSEKELLEKILSCRNADGGFAWFQGMNSSPVITAIILERFAKLRDRGFEVPDLTSSVKYLDLKQFSKTTPVWFGGLSDAQYLYVRSMYASVPFTEKNIAKDKKKSIKSYLIPSAKQGRGLQGQILAKARRLLTLRNLIEKDGGMALAKAWGVSFAKSCIKSSIKADMKSLLEYAVEHRDGGWYYPNAVMPWRGLLEGEAYAHALLCSLLSDAGGYAPPGASAFSTAEEGAYPSAAKVADGIRLWLMLQKETQKWDSDPAYIDAITAIMDGSREVLGTKVVALSATYTVPFSEVKASGNGFTIERHFYKGKEEIQPGDSLAVGDRIRIVYRIWNAENRSFVKLTAGREAALNPVQQLSGVVGGFINPGYRNVRASATEYYFDSYPEENTEISEEFFVTRAGAFQAPATVIESLYAPHYRANTNYHEPTTFCIGR